MRNVAHFLVTSNDELLFADLRESPLILNWGRRATRVDHNTGMANGFALCLERDS
jgi:hypothetical protein